MSGDSGRRALARAQRDAVFRRLRQRPQDARRRSVGEIVGRREVLGVGVAQAREQRRGAAQPRAERGLVLDRVRELVQIGELELPLALGGRRCELVAAGVQGIGRERRLVGQHRQPDLVVEAGRGPDPARERRREPLLEVREPPQAMAALGDPVGTPEAARHIDPGTAHRVVPRARSTFSDIIAYSRIW